MAGDTLDTHAKALQVNLDPRCLPVFSRDVLERLRSGDHSWEDMTPTALAALIKLRGRLGYRADRVRRVS